MNNSMNKNTRIWLVIVILVIVAVAATFWAAATFTHALYWFRPPPPFAHPPYPSPIPGDYELFYTAEAVVSTVNVTLSLILVLIYIDMYKRTKSEFTIGLIVFLVAFFLTAIVSNPFVTRVFGYRAFGLGPFALLPGLFTLGALAILLYLSVKY